MKKIYIGLLILGMASCKSVKTQENIPSTEIDLSTAMRGKVYKIDSLNNYYLIYVSDEKLSYKIVSEKVNKSTCNEIMIDSTYNFKINQLTSDTPPPEGNSNIPTPINHLDIARCVKFSGNTEICTEPGINNLYSSSNLTGLCIVKKKESK
ncbi:hypothetical protein KIM67_17190 [Flagellimonas sp. 389]|uniref:hypothetical protein n=1 Tax=Flagellimonas sp. 389 TaxID=2835862 RepID=UPI001BD29313|nr:hypothetical protein [Flagellimonas sp. 389]MBS9464161.1 hypothetical protein [Flagellimonas sp. 389]